MKSQNSALALDRIKSIYFSCTCIILLMMIITQHNIAFAINTINVQEGSFEQVPIAVNDFSLQINNDKNSEESNIGKQIQDVIITDLKHAGVFRVIPKIAFIENKQGVKDKPLFAAWQQINANFLLNGVIRKVHNKIEVEYILWDVILEKEMTKGKIKMPEVDYRKIAHIIADNIYKLSTGYEGFFNSKVLYIAETGNRVNRVKRVAMMNLDGTEHEYLTNGNATALTPRISPKGDKILYLSFGKMDMPQVYLMTLKDKKKSLLGNFPGMSFAPRFSPDGKKAVMSITQEGITHIHELDLSTKKTRKLTFDGSINTSPDYSPDGKYIAFNSNRSGRRQLHVLNLKSGNIHQISSGAGSYAEPNWSISNRIVFTKMSAQYGFTIGVMKLNNNNETVNERLIARGYLVETPTWASNGRMIAFTRGRRTSQDNATSGLHHIYMMDFTGMNEFMLPTPHDASDPELFLP